MKRFVYTAVEVKQTPNSEPFYLISCKAEELLEWCDVPRKKEQFMAGYQRELSDRHNDISEYFKQDSAHNIIPNAIIVALSPDSHRVIQQNGRTELEILFEELETVDAIKKVLADFKTRLSDDELSSVAVQVKELTAEDGDDPEGEADEATPPASYMSTLTAQLEIAVKDPAAQGEVFRDAVTSYVQGVSKPGLIIDGQHRVFGAKNVSEFDVFLPVVLVPNLEHKEQVFHFYVLNNKARPLTKTELRTIVSTSLSKSEIEGLYQRFKQVGVATATTEWTHRLNTDAQSPFLGMINMGLSGSKGFIQENVAYQVVSKFMNLPRKYRLLIDNVKSWERLDQDKLDSDKYTRRLNLFYGLWQAVRERYPSAWNEAVKNREGQILQKVSLLNLQEYLIETMNSEMPKRNKKKEPSPFESAEVVKEECSYALTFLEEDFFIKEWKLKGLDTATGHRTFMTSLKTAIANQSANLGNILLFKG
jgi:DGQHR domain-containing protein